MSNMVKKPLESKGLWSSLPSKTLKLPCPSGSLYLSKKRASQKVAPLKHEERRSLWCDGYKKEVIDELSTPVIAFMRYTSVVSVHHQIKTKKKALSMLFRAYT
ncbi:hypothetical protein DY000_02034167 [Brassica cretica]|uniref:Uncharacterized protein n=1 Tax=Brassica cretica TaxID=69181 RepID=A0ABQ7DPH9_BRACR|nr:hypothetical protein DY000_02034167 [Brassica cretica]